MDPAAVERAPGSPVARAYNVTVRRNLLNGGPPQPRLRADAQRI